MQNSFVGDVGDLAKYSLLRALRGLSPAAQPLLSLGVVWYVPDAATARRTPWRHGKDVGYLFNQSAYREHRDLDPVLFEELKRIVCKDRTLDAVQESDLLGSDTQYWDRPVPLPDDRSARVICRTRWLADARNEVRGRELVFLDPDTGMAHEHRSAPKRLSRTQRDSPSYAFVDEVEAFMHAGQSVVVYQSFSRNSSRDDQKASWRQLFPDRSVMIREFGSRAFVILPTEGQTDFVQNRLRSWRRCFPANR